MSHVQMSAFKCSMVSEYIFKHFLEILWKIYLFKKYIVRNSILIPFGKIKEGKERVLWFFLNTPWYLGPTAGIRWVLPADEDERTDVPQECISQCRQSLLEDKITGNGSHFYKRKKRKTKCWFVIFFGCFRISIFRWISHFCEFMKGKLWLPVFFSQAIHSVFHFTSLKWFHSVRNVICNSVFTQGVNCQWGGWDLGSLDHEHLLYCLLHILIVRLSSAGNLT